MGDIKDEVAETAKKVVTIFTKEYTKAYTLALVRIIKEEVNAGPEPDWKLKKRPVCAPYPLCFLIIVSVKMCLIYVFCQLILFFSFFLNKKY